MPNCEHRAVECINHYDTIRKYRCADCGGVMMCACDEEFAARFLPHQLGRGQELETGQNVPVTLGFVTGICNSCRGLPEEAHPKAEMYGRSSNIHRYYWREISMETARRFGAWCDAHGLADEDWLVLSEKRRDVWDDIGKQVVADIKALHASQPKYQYAAESQDDVLARYAIETIRLDAVYIPHSGRHVEILDQGEPCSAEEFAARYLRRAGYQVLLTESVPLHALFAIFMWPLIQDPGDPDVQPVSFGDRAAFESRLPGGVVSTLLPRDFGRPGYAVRRAAEIDEHLLGLDAEMANLMRIFDYWVEPSAGLRQYLWAHRAQDITKAREVLSVLGPKTVVNVLKYLVKDYWRRYLGWPDLIAYAQDGFLFAEVKSSHDKLSEDQKNWIRGNSAELQLPFKLIKIHRTTAGRR